MLARRGLGTSSKSSRVGELSLAMRLHGKKIVLAPEFPYCSRREGNPGTRDKLSRVLVNMSGGGLPYKKGRDARRTS